MTEHISKEQAVTVLQIIASDYSDSGFTSAEYVAEYCADTIGRLPPADVRPVVFCRECKHSHMTYGGTCKYCDFFQEDGGEALYLPVGFFCAAGERKDSDG